MLLVAGGAVLGVPVRAVLGAGSAAPRAGLPGCIVVVVAGVFQELIQIMMQSVR